MVAALAEIATKIPFKRFPARAAPSSCLLARQEVRMCVTTQETSYAPDVCLLSAVFSSLCDEGFSVGGCPVKQLERRN